MIQANELRIGNIVKDDNGHICIIRAIDGEREIKYNGNTYIGSTVVFNSKYNGTLGKWVQLLSPIPLTEMVSSREDGSKLIERWLNTKNTVDYLGAWESINNNNFNSPEFRGIREDVGSGGFFLSVKKWIETTNAIGITAKTGRYGGTYAHVDIALEFATYVSPIKHLHQLQNLYFALTGKELEVKL